MGHLQPAIHRCKHFHDALCTVKWDTCNSHTATHVNLGFIRIFPVLHTDSNDLLYFKASLVANLQMKEGIFFPFLSSLAEADVPSTAAQFYNESCHEKRWC
jgi:hypothetical protein